VNRVAGPKAPDAIAYDCQLTLSPRLCRGIRALLEDADDVGRLEVTAEAVHFTGDRIQIVLPFESISGIMQTKCDWRNFWVAGRKTRITTSAFADIEYIEFGEREARTYFSSKRVSTEIHYAIACGLEVSREA